MSLWGELPFQDRPAERLAQSQTGPRPGADGVVHAAGLFPQAELAALNVLRDALRGRPDEGEFPIVDRPRAVHGEVIDQAALHQVDDEALHPRSEDVGAHEQDAGRSPAAGLDQAAAEDGQCGMIEDRQHGVQRQ